MTQLTCTHWIASLCLGIFLHASAATAADDTLPVTGRESDHEEAKAATLRRAKGNVQCDQEPVVDSTLANDPRPRPNIILIMADDLGDATPC